MWQGTKTERLLTPDEFQDRLTLAGGVNRYDEPNYRVEWSQTKLMRAGGEWTPPGELPFKGYRDIPLGMEPCWMLTAWQPPEKYGPMRLYYMDNYDWDSGLQTLGEYPYSGRYEVVKPFVWKGLVNGRLVVEHLPLTGLLIDFVIPLMKQAQSISFARYKQLMLEHKERQDREQISQIEAGLRDAYPAFGTASRSASHLSCNSVVQKKAEVMERYWKAAVNLIHARGRGLSTGEIQ